MQCALCMLLPRNLRPASAGRPTPRHHRASAPEFSVTASPPQKRPHPRCPCKIDILCETCGACFTAAFRKASSCSLLYITSWPAATLTCPPDTLKCNAGTGFYLQRNPRCFSVLSADNQCLQHAPPVWQYSRGRQQMWGAPRLTGTSLDLAQDLPSPKKLQSIYYLTQMKCM